jgi:hypothetical protein
MCTLPRPSGIAEPSRKTHVGQPAPARSRAGPRPTPAPTS